MALPTTIIIDLIAGLLASLMMKIETGIIIHLILGVAGSFFGWLDFSMDNG
ncbi:MAG: hypothetical protein SVP52_00815 [Chloroflexota bacterium]|nr:hypothetical protein [Chloroflexota bacterium]